MNKSQRKSKEVMIEHINSDKGKRFKVLIDCERHKGVEIMADFTPECRELEDEEAEETVLASFLGLSNFLCEKLDMNMIELSKLLIMNSDAVKEKIINENKEMLN